jgi:carbon monoxide dehydrogenase subunit G
MELNGKELIPQPVQKVWDGLNDPIVLKACISGCEEITLVADNEYKVILLASVGPVKARFNGKLFLSEVNPPTSYSLLFEGTGGSAGFAKGGAQVRLSPQGEATTLDYTAKANIGGKIAQVGSRLIDGVARKIAAEFFTKFNEIVSAPALDSVAADSSMPASVESSLIENDDRSTQSGKPSTQAWLVLALIAFGLIGVYLYF